MLTVFTHFLRRGRQGGVELFLDGLLAGLRKLSVEFEALQWKGPHMSRFLSEQIDILRRPEHDILLPNYFVPPATWKSTNITTVIHDLLFLRYPGSLPRAKREWLKLTIPYALRRANRVVAISEFTKQQILDHYGHVINSDDIHVIPNPIDLTRFERSVFPEQLQGVDYILSPSSGFWHKNVSLLIRAFSRRPELKGLKLVLVGQRPSDLGWSANTAEFRSEYGRLLQENAVVELGYVPDEVLAGLYQRSACVAFPSLYEGFGMPIFEALGLGAKVACGAVGAVPEHCGDLVFRVEDPSSEDEWVEKLLHAASSSHRPPQAVLDRVIGRLEPSVVARKYVDVAMRP